LRNFSVTAVSKYDSHGFKLGTKLSLYPKYLSLDNDKTLEFLTFELTSTAPVDMLDDWSTNILQHDPMRIYRARKDGARHSVSSKYAILGFISSGTYGRVYKAQSLEDEGTIHAIKKFKPDKEGDVITYTGISQSAIREIAVRLFHQRG
jgi:hypothetical protein